MFESKFIRKGLGKCLNLKILIDNSNHLILTIFFYHSNVLQIVLSTLPIEEEYLFVELVDGNEKSVFAEGKYLSNLIV